jgi:hypothetical protein
MKKTILFAILATGVTITAKAQLRVVTGNNISIGASGVVSTQTEKLGVIGRSYFIEPPALSGVSIGSYQLGPNHLTSFIPQWGNSVLLGTPGVRFLEAHVSFMNGVSVFQTSDERLKTNIKPLASNEALNNITKIKCYTYDYNEAAFTNSLPAMMPLLKELGKNQFGVMAQELKTVLPSLVKTEEQTGNLSVNYIGLIPVLIEGIKAQQQQIEALKAEIELLKQKRD